MTPAARSAARSFVKHVRLTTPKDAYSKPV
jgi:hypothetical protein